MLQIESTIIGCKEQRLSPFRAGSWFGNIINGTIDVSAVTKRFFESNYLLPKWHRITNRLTAYCHSQLKQKRSQVDIAKDLSISASTVGRWLQLLGLSSMPLIIAIPTPSLKASTILLKIIKRIAYGYRNFDNFRRHILGSVHTKAKPITSP